MTPAQAAYEAFQHAIGTDSIYPHPLSKEAKFGLRYHVNWEDLPDFAKAAWVKAADAARNA
jgi:hypothetical protein